MADESLDLKNPVESEDYQECSNLSFRPSESIMKDAMDTGRNKMDG